MARKQPSFKKSKSFKDRSSWARKTGFAGGGLPSGAPGRTFREVSERDKETRRNVINKYRSLRGENLLGPNDPLPVGLPGGSFAALSDADKAKLIRAEDFIKDPVASERGQFFLKSEAEKLQKPRITEETMPGEELAPVTEEAVTPEVEVKGEPGFTEEEIAGGTEFERETGTGRASSLTPGEIIDIASGKGLAKAGLFFGLRSAMKVASGTPAEKAVTVITKTAMSEMGHSLTTQWSKTGVSPTANKKLLKAMDLMGGRKAELSLRYATNPKSTTLTQKLLAAMGIVGSWVPIIGTYPFAGFIKEEALQTLSFGISASEKAGDIEGMEEQINLQKEMLDPSGWDKLIDLVPFANIMTSLWEFSEAARLKLIADEKRLEKMREKIEKEEKQIGRTYL